MIRAVTYICSPGREDATTFPGAADAAYRKAGRCPAGALPHAARCRTPDGGGPMVPASCVPDPATGMIPHHRRSGQR